MKDKKFKRQCASCREIKNKEDLIKITKDFKTISKPETLYSYVRLEDINKLNEIVNLKRIKIIAQDGPTDYMRQVLNKMDEETFKVFIDYHLATCERYELLGASSHTLDILEK